MFFRLLVKLKVQLCRHYLCEIYSLQAIGINLVLNKTFSLENCELRIPNRMADIYPSVWTSLVYFFLIDVALFMAP